GLDRLKAVLVAFFLAHLVELEVVRELAPQVTQGDHDAFELFFLLAELLGLLRLVPDGRVFQGGVDGPQALRLGVEVKDTPGGLACGRRDRPAACRSGCCVLRPCLVIRERAGFWHGAKRRWVPACAGTTSQ